MDDMEENEGSDHWERFQKVKEGFMFSKRGLDALRKLDEAIYDTDLGDRISACG